MPDDEIEPCYQLMDNAIYDDNYFFVPGAH